MGKFNEYSQKATPADNDTLMIYDATAKANKLSPFSGIWNWIVGKLTNAVISNLQTSNKTVIGALNELNSKAFMDVPTTSLNVVEYIKTLDGGKLHFFRTANNTPGNPYEIGTCLFMIYIINRGNDGVGISINHSTTAYYLRFSRGEIIYSAL